MSLVPQAGRPWVTIPDRHTVTTPGKQNSGKGAGERTKLQKLQNHRGEASAVPGVTSNQPYPAHLQHPMMKKSAWLYSQEAVSSSGSAVSQPHHLPPAREAFQKGSELPPCWPLNLREDWLWTPSPRTPRVSGRVLSSLTDPKTKWDFSEIHWQEKNLEVDSDLSLHTSLSPEVLSSSIDQWNMDPKHLRHVCMAT